MLAAANVTTVQGDFVGQFNNMSDVDAYTWAWQQYGDRVATNITIWMGGVCGDQVEPGVADIGVAQRAFFNDLSTLPSTVDEYTVRPRRCDREGRGAAGSPLQHSHSSACRRCTARCQDHGAPGSVHHGHWMAFVLYVLVHIEGCFAKDPA
jgi:hypothetical protein